MAAKLLPGWLHLLGRQVASFCFRLPMLPISCLCFASPQGWQTLFAVDCFLASSSLPGTENIFKIVSIKGDTFFTIKPKSSNWVAQAVKEGILLGRVTLRIRALPSAAGNYVCQLRFNIGFRELLYTKLEFGSQ